MIHFSHFVAVGLFGLGLFGFLVRRNAIIVLMCVELMLNAVNLVLVEIAMRTQTAEGILLVVFVVTVAAGEAAIGLCIILNMYRFKNSVNLNLFKTLQG